MATTIEQVYDYLKAQGLQPENREFGIFFRYQMFNFIILDYKDDPLFFRIVMPGIMDVDENNRMDVLEACNKITGEMKIVKAFINDNENSSDVWLSTEQLLDQDPGFDDIIPRSLNTLLAAHREFGSIIDA